MKIGETIRSLRKEKGYKQFELAELLEITPTYLSMIEVNKKVPPIALLQRIADLLEIPLPILFVMSMEKSDVSDSKREAFEIISPSMKGLAQQLMTK